MRIPDKWDIRALRYAREVSTWSKDPGTKVGAVAFRNRNPVSSGYNGFPRGMEDRDERLMDREFKLRYTVHAEINCIFNAAREGVSLAGATMYVYGLPVCCGCAPGLVQAGIVRVVMSHPNPCKPAWEESHQWSRELFDEVGIETDFIPLHELDEKWW